MLAQIEGFHATAGRRPRRKTYGVKVGHVCVGGGAPIVVQSMTNTDTADIESTFKQTMELAEAGSEIVRWTVTASIPATWAQDSAAMSSSPLSARSHGTTASPFASA